MSTTKFDLGRERDAIPEGPLTRGEKKKKGKKEVYFPSLYIYEGPDGLAERIRELAKEADGKPFDVTICITPTRTSSETITDKDGKETEKSSIDVQIHSIKLPDSAVTEEDEDEGIESDDEELADKMDENARSSGLLKSASADEDEDEE